MSVSRQFDMLDEQVKERVLFVEHYRCLEVQNLLDFASAVTQGALISLSISCLLHRQIKKFKWDLLVEKRLDYFLNDEL